MHNAQQQLLRLSPLFLLLLLSACMTMPAKQQALNQQLSWEQRQAELNTINNWTIKGAIGVQNQHEGWSASVNWQQTRDQYRLQLYGPLDAGQLRLTGQPGKVQMITADNKQAQAISGDALLYQQTGWKLPVDNLKYWVRGIPAPGLPADEKLDSYNHLRQLQQQGWTIRYQRYTAVNGVDLPSKIEFLQRDVKIRMVISSWRLGG